MRAAVFTGIGQPLEVLDLEPLAPGPSDVVVAVGASGVCHSDLSVHTGGRPLPPPAVLGHEAAGTVVAVGADVRLVQPGDRVVTTFIPACGACFWCIRGESHLCAVAFDVAGTPRATLPDGRQAVSYLGLGTFAEQTTVHEASVVKVSTDLPDEQLALLGCGVTTGIGAVLRTAEVRPGDAVAVLGCGGVGQAIVQAAVLAGAGRIIAIDPIEWKRAAALTAGATDQLDPTAEGTREAVLALTEGRGVDHAFEVTGLASVVSDALALTRRGGGVVVVGMPRHDAQIAFPAMPFFAEGKRVLVAKYGGAQVRRDIPTAVALAEAGRLDLASLVSARLPIDGVNTALGAIADGEVIRSVLVP